MNKQIESLNKNNETIEKAKKEKLLLSLPHELKERWENASLKDIEKVVEKRSTLGYESIRGYHVSKIDLPIDSYLIPSPEAEGKLFYSQDIKNLYGRPGGGFIYVIEGGPDNLMIDENFGWKIYKGKAKIVDKIPITSENIEKLGAKFAKCEYH
ncbi:MAG: hypothetical protein AAB496_00345 [Patescibacteria group bacterium]